MHDHGARGQPDLKSLLKREAHRHALMHGTIDGFFLSEKGIIIEVTESLLERSGYERDEVIGKPATDFFELCTRPTEERGSCSSTDGSLDAVATTKSGQRRRIAVTSRSQLVGERTLQLTGIRDVTETRHLEEQRQQAMKTMNTFARLASGVAHDFRNVLLSIRLFADMLGEDIDEPGRRIVREILRSVESGAALTRLLLNYAHREPVVPRVLSLNTIVRASERLLRSLVGNDVRMTLDLAPDLAKVRADPTELQQVFLNLGINARDAMSHTGTLAVQTRNVDVSPLAHPPNATSRIGRYAVLIVRDSGSGMTPEVQARMFDPYFTTKEPGEGTGLGLAIVYQIVERNGGFIVVESDVGTGTAFFIHLPVAESDR